MKLKIFAIILSILVFTQCAFAAPFNAKAKTKRIPAGTKFQLQMLNSISSINSEGKDFSAILKTDQTADSDVILPSGSLVRGSVREVVPAKRMSRGAILYLDFDHVVTPTGRQLPLSLNIVGRTDLTYDGGITTTKGWGDAVKLNWDKTVEITKNATEWGNDIVNDGAAKYVTVPLSAVGGAIGGGVYFVVDSIADLIRKGADVNIFANDVLNVILVEPVDVPVL